MNEEQHSSEREQIGSLAGVGAGVIAGASLGSMVLPVVGTFAGALIGGILGSQVGRAVGDAVLGVIDTLASPLEKSSDIPPPPASNGPATGGELLAQLERLSQLRAQGAMTDDEYRVAKARLLGL